MIDDRIDAVKAWLRREDGRLGDIFGLWTQGKRDDGWVADRLVTEGHLAALIEDAAPQPDTASRELREAAKAVCDGADQDETYCFGCHNERPCEHDALRAALAATEGE